MHYNNKYDPTIVYTAEKRKIGDTKKVNSIQIFALKRYLDYHFFNYYTEPYCIWSYNSFSSYFKWSFSRSFSDSITKHYKYVYFGLNSFANKLLILFMIQSFIEAYKSFQESCSKFDLCLENSNLTCTNGICLCSSDSYWPDLGSACGKCR